MMSFSVIIVPLLMLVAYLSLSLTSVIFFTYGLKKILENGNLLFSINACIEKHSNCSALKLNKLENVYQKKNDKIFSKMLKKQQALYDKNTKFQIRTLEKSTKKQLKALRKHISPTKFTEYRQEIKQCVGNQDMEGLLAISFILIDSSSVSRELIPLIKEQ